MRWIKSAKFVTWLYRQGAEQCAPSMPLPGARGVSTVTTDKPHVRTNTSAAFYLLDILAPELLHGRLLVDAPLPSGSTLTARFVRYICKQTIWTSDRETCPRRPVHCSTDESWRCYCQIVRKNTHKFVGVSAVLYINPRSAKLNTAVPPDTK